MARHLTRPVFHNAPNLIFAQELLTYRVNVFISVRRWGTWNHLELKTFAITSLAVVKRRRVRPNQWKKVVVVLNVKSVPLESSDEHTLHFIWCVCCLCVAAFTLLSERVYFNHVHYCGTTKTITTTSLFTAMKCEFLNIYIEYFLFYIGFILPSNTTKMISLSKD